MKDHGEFLILKAALRLAGWLAGWLTPVHRDRKRKRQWNRCDGSAPEYFFSLDVSISATRDGNGGLEEWKWYIWKERGGGGEREEDSGKAKNWGKSPRSKRSLLVDARRSKTRETFSIIKSVDFVVIKNAWASRYKRQFCRLERWRGPWEIECFRLRWIHEGSE